MVMAPLLLLVVFGYAARFDVERVPTVVVGEASALEGGLPGLFRVVDRRPGGRDEAVDALRRGEAAAAVVGGPRPEVLLDGAELFSAQAALRSLAASGARPGDGPAARGPRGNGFPAARPRVEVLFNPELEASAVMVPAIAGMILAFIGTLITSLGVVRERQAGTLEALAVMPFRPRDVFLGKVAPYFLVASLDLALVVGVGVWLFDVPFRGSLGTFALGAVLFLFVTLGLGVLVSSVSQNQGQAIQLAMMLLLPQVLLSGMIFPVESMGAGVRWISFVLPLTYFIDLSRGVMLRAAPLDALGLPLALLAALGSVVFGLAVLRFRQDLGSGQAPPAGPGGAGGGTGAMSWGARDLVVRYRGRPALSGVGLDVAPGSITVVVGADGAGKTTLLRVLAGAREPDGGDVRRPPPERVGFLSAGSGVYPDLTVAENLAFAGRAYRVRDLERRAGELLGATGLEEARHRLAGHLSGGMRQKLGVAMAMVHCPDLLVLDEPTTGLDPVSRADIWGLLAAAAADGAAVLFATTYLEEAERASWVLVLDEGRVLVAGPPEDIPASVPGAVLESHSPPGGLASWRRGRTWRAWSPEGGVPGHARAVRPDIEDAVMVAALSRAR